MLKLSEKSLPIEVKVLGGLHQGIKTVSSSYQTVGFAQIYGRIRNLLEGVGRETMSVRDLQLIGRGLATVVELNRGLHLSILVQNQSRILDRNIGTQLALGSIISERIRLVSCEDASISSLGSVSGFLSQIPEVFGVLPHQDGLPSEYVQSQDQGPRSDAIGPCQQYVPPFRAGLALLCLLAGAYGAYEGSRVSGWLAALYALCIVALAGCVVILIQSGHQYDCGYQSNHSEYRQEFPHDGETVTRVFARARVGGRGEQKEMKGGAPFRMTRYFNRLPGLVEPHVKVLYWDMAAMPRMMARTAGPRRTMNMLGKMKRTRGKMILTVVLAAVSSAS